MSILLVKNPAGANEVLRTLTLEDGAARPLARAERPDRRRPRRLLDLGRRLRGAGAAASRRVDVLGHARRGDGAAAEVRGHRRAPIVVERDLGALARRGGGGRATAASALRAAHLHGAARAARPAGRARPRRSGGRNEPAQPTRRDLARRGVRVLRRPTCRSGASWPPRGRGPVLDLGAGTGRVALDLAAAGYDVTALDSEPALVTRSGRARAASAGCACARSAADARALRARALRSRSRSRRCRSRSCSAAPTAARDWLACVAATWSRGGAVRGRARRPVRGHPRRGRRCPPLPDVREEDGWVFSSRPSPCAPSGDGAADRPAAPGGVPDRRAQRVDGDTIVLDHVTPEELEREADAARLPRAAAPLGAGDRRLRRAAPS